MRLKFLLAYLTLCFSLHAAQSENRVTFYSANSYINFADIRQFIFQTREHLDGTEHICHNFDAIHEEIDQEERLFQSGQSQIALLMSLEGELRAYLSFLVLPEPVIINLISKQLIDSAKLIENLLFQFPRARRIKMALPDDLILTEFLEQKALKGDVRDLTLERDVATLIFRENNKCFVVTSENIYALLREALQSSELNGPESATN